MIDLHTHSTFSDGSLSPEALAAEAARLGLTAVALTDHDGMGGIPLFMKACRSVGVRGIPGVEISIDFKSGTMHMLGYFTAHGGTALDKGLTRIRKGRETRNQIILEKLNALGYSLTWPDVAKFARESVVGRPHFAQALIEKGYVKRKDDAFERLLAKGRPAYVDRFRLTAEEGIAMIRKAGGLAVLAHPYTLGLHKKGLRTLMAELSEQGLGGIEAYYPEHDAEQCRFCLSLAGEHNLAVTGGSDFHGAMNPALRLGSGFGNLAVPDDLVDKLYERLGKD